MTDKEQIIIDGCNVSGCENYRPKNRFTCYPYICNCHQKPDCHFKQLARKTQKCEEIFVKTYQMWMYYIASGLNNASDLNIQCLLEDLGKVTKMLAELSNIKNSTLSYYAGQALDETNRYHKTLEDIERAIRDEMCDTLGCLCVYCDDKNLCIPFKILNIIRKAKEDK